MALLEFELSAPMQSYGVQTISNYRPTADKPTKSSILGLLASSLGIRRSEITKLADLKNAVEINVYTKRAGNLMRDFQIARYGEGTRDLKIAEKFYLTDAKFLIAVKASNDLIKELDHAIKHPTFAPYLGRRGCIPDLIKPVATFD